MEKQDIFDKIMEFPLFSVFNQYIENIKKYYYICFLERGLS